MSLWGELNRLVGLQDIESLRALLEHLKSANRNAEDGTDPTAISYDIPSILNRRNQLRYTLLHVAIFSRSIEIVRALVESGADINIKCHGSSCLHLCMAVILLPQGVDFGLECLALLLEQPSCVISAKDDQNLQIIHLAAELPDPGVLRLVLDSAEGADCLESKDRNGLRPLHRSAVRNSSTCAELLLKHGATVTATNLHGATPLHVAAEHGAEEVWRVLVAAGADIKAKDKYGRTPADVKKQFGRGRLAPKTAVITDASFLEHYTCDPAEARSPDAPPENTHRIEVLLDPLNGVLRGSDLGTLVFEEESPRATVADVLRVHEWSYVRRIQSVCEKVGNEEEDELGRLDGDTTISRKSYEAALHAAGAVCRAVDLVMDNEGDVKNAFCAIRPPGHHSGPKGVVVGEEGGPDSHGFCLLNNIAIGAAYAVHVHRANVKRVAIVDFDVHHGNGTEECVRWLVPGIETAEMLRGDCFGSMQMPRYKPWLDGRDSDNVLFVSVHGFGPREKGMEHLMPQAAFYPGSGRTVLPTIRSEGTEELLVEGKSVLRHVPFGVEMEAVDDVEEMESGEEGAEEQGGDDEEDDMNSPVDDVDGDSEEEESMQATPSRTSGRLQQLRDMYTRDLEGKFGSSLILDVGIPMAQEDIETDAVAAAAYRSFWRNKFRQDIFPRLLDFDPDMILISAGFDAHRKDGINSGYISLVEEDFEWVTKHLVRIANTCCEGRVVSALEGGYQLGGEFTSAFARSVKTHVGALALGAQSRAGYSHEETTREMELEQRALEDMEARRQAKEERDRIERLAQQEASLQRETPNEEITSPDDGLKKRKRGGSKPVDYIALNKELGNG